MTYFLHLDLDYSVAQTPASCVAGLQVYAATTGFSNQSHQNPKVGIGPAKDH